MNRDNGRAINGRVTPEYNSWSGMQKRCMSKNCKDYENYGGRGINICDEWSSFEKFLIDMGRKQEESLSLDRIDNNKGYSKENCRWATKLEQITNRNVVPKYTYSCVTRRGSKWIAQVRRNKQSCYLGRYECEHEAAMVVDMFKEKVGMHPYSKESTI